MKIWSVYAWINEWMHAWTDVWADAWMDEYMTKGRAWGSQLSLLHSSVDTYIRHCCCSLLPHSLGPIPSAPHCRLTWVLKKWFRRMCHEDDRSSSITARLQLLWEAEHNSMGWRLQDSGPRHVACCMPLRPHLQSFDKGVSQPPCLIVTAWAQGHLVNVQWKFDKLN